MLKSELFKAVLDAVSRICEIRKESILGKMRYSPVVDARVIGINELIMRGFTTKEIALMAHRERVPDDMYPPMEQIALWCRRIDYLKSTFNYRCENNIIFASMADDVHSAVEKFIETKK